ncbi:peptide chain release factor 2 [bacterium]|nr:peptide chain release factor 2 [bacterium]
MSEELKRLLASDEERIQNLGGIFDIASRKEKALQLEQLTAQPDFWSDNEKAQGVLRQITELKSWTGPWDSIRAQFDELSGFLELAAEENDASALEEVERGRVRLNEALADLELRRMLGGEDDGRNAILTIHPGAGGTESQDWAEMLFRMYLRFAQRHQFQSDVMDYQDGDEAGLKSASIEIKGANAYGYLKAEAGVHRLVRISPFDANKRRHTSFASVFVYPEIDESITVTIDPSELRIDTYRSSGAGGQHVNKTSSAVRITHIPTGIVTQCQNERSQHQNKANAMKMLTARLYQLRKEEEGRKFEAMEKQKKDISWGNQIRSYVFHPYNMVKDHRTDTETSDVQSVMDGDLDPFIKAYLLEFNR